MFKVSQYSVTVLIRVLDILSCEHQHLLILNVSLNVVSALNYRHFLHFLQWPKSKSKKLMCCANVRVSNNGKQMTVREKNEMLYNTDTKDRWGKGQEEERAEGTGPGRRRKSKRGQKEEDGRGEEERGAVGVLIETRTKANGRRAEAAGERGMRGQRNES